MRKEVYILAFFSVFVFSLSANERKRVFVLSLELQNEKNTTLQKNEAKSCTHGFNTDSYALVFVLYQILLLIKIITRKS